MNEHLFIMRGQFCQPRADQCLGAVRLYCLAMAHKHHAPTSRPWFEDAVRYDFITLPWLIGRNDYDGAIRVLEDRLSRNPNEIETMEMIAQCHQWARRDDEAMAAATRTYALDSSSFEANRMLSGYYVKHGDHDSAARHARLGLENFPAQFRVPKIVIRIVSWVLRLHPRLRKRNLKAEMEMNFEALEEEKARWYDWAMEYLAWYDSTHGGSERPTVH
jgi:tetratricopeptide (TPR) repeat protein